MVLLLLTGLAVQAATPPAPTSEATIRSDELELQDNGAFTVFMGNVVLRQDPYLLKADRMVRSKATQIVDVKGRVKGTWNADTGEKFVAVGDFGRYSPTTEITELWGRSKVTRWETAKDTAPVVVTAERFIADRRAGTVRAVGKVEVVQSTTSRVRCEEALYVQKEQTIHLSGPGGVFVHWEDARGISDFKGEKGRVILQPRSARLMEQVKGRVIPL
jgi:lipopolysaccharide export system protein LptA